MTKFTKQPYIEGVLAELSGENKAKLLNLINGKSAAGTGSTSYTLVESFSDISGLGAVTAIEYRYSKTILWKGYLVKTTHYTAFITVKSGIDLTKADIYSVASGHISWMDDVSADALRSLLREDAYIAPSELPTPTPELPEVPADASTKTYVLQLINGVKTWVEVVDDSEPTEPTEPGEEDVPQVE